MSKRLKKFWAGLILGCIMAVGMPYQLLTAYASNAKLSFNDPSVIAGGQVTVTMKIKTTAGDPLESCNVVITYDPEFLEFVEGENAQGGAGTLRLSDSSEVSDNNVFDFSVKFKSLKAGITQLTVQDQEIYDINAQPVTLNKTGSSKVTIAAKANVSTDAKLTNLKISPGTLTPAFSEETVDYTATVGLDVSKLIVSGVASNAGASVVILGSNDLQMGENTVICRVTAEDGQTVKDYTIKVKKEEGGETAAVSPEQTASAQLSETRVKIQDVEYIIAKSFDETALPSGFQTFTYDYKGLEITAGQNEDGSLILIFLADKSGAGNFYLYNKASDSWCPYMQLDSGARSVTFLPVDANMTVPKGFVKTPIDINGKTVEGWVTETDKDGQYYIFYAMNGKGEKNFYRYDRAEETIQRYFQDGDTTDKVALSQYKQLESDLKTLKKSYDIRAMIILALIAVSLVLFGMLVLILLKKGGSKETQNPEEEDDDYYLEYDEEEELLPPVLEVSGREERYEREKMAVRGPESERKKETPKTIYDKPVYKIREIPSEKDEDDFEEALSLEEMERSLSSSLAKDAGRVERRQRGDALKQTAVAAESNSKAEINEKDEDDFEILDL